MEWWRTGVVYQIYPRSFQDMSGDGVGDLQGIRHRLDHLVELGVDAAWISPCFRSPMADFGYDVSDYRDIDPLFGTLADMDALIEEAHARDLRVLLDLVPNHTSDQHPWFQESRVSRTSPKRDWYHWRDPAPDGGPPSNWTAYFGGPSWTLDGRTGQYYLHQFLPQQPDLNHANPEVRAAIHDVMRFWLDRGVDGFRVDVMHLMAKHPDYPDEEPNPDYRPGVDPPQEAFLHRCRRDREEVHEIVRGMRAVMDEYPERVMIGEIYLPFDRLVRYYGPGLDECHLPFNFALITQQEWSAPALRALVDEYEACLPEGAWPNWVLGNHDQPRVASRLPPGQARVAMMLLLTLRGTPTLYYGDELEMRDVEIPRECWQDPAGLRQPDFEVATRDPERTPMQWSAAPNAGFCHPGVSPWLPLAPDHQVVNRDVQAESPGSFLNFTSALLSLRRRTPALNRGSFRSVDTGEDQVFAFLREHEGDRWLVLLNTGAGPTHVDLGAFGESAHVVLTTEMVNDWSTRPSLSRFPVERGQGLVVHLEPPEGGEG